MYKKFFMIYCLLVFPYVSYTMASTNLALPLYYENIISREYNRINGRNNYVSVDYIMNQSLDGKSKIQKDQVLNDLKSLKTAIQIAQQDATTNGKRLWYWFYLFKDNDAIIDLLSHLYDKVNAKIASYEWDMRWDITKAAWYTGKNIGIATLGIIILHLSKGHLPQDKFIQDLSLYDLLVAPTLAGFDVAKAGMKHGLEWSAYLASRTGETADTLGEWIFAHKKKLES